MIAGWPVALTKTQVTLADHGGETPPPRGVAASRGGTVSAALRAYLDKQVETGAITPAERKAIGR